MACFADINVSLGSVATYAGAVGFLISIELQIYQWKKLVNRLRFERFDRIMTGPVFWPTLNVLLYCSIVLLRHPVQQVATVASFKF